MSSRLCLFTLKNCLYFIIVFFTKMSVMCGPANQMGLPNPGLPEQMVLSLVGFVSVLGSKLNQISYQLVMTTTWSIFHQPIFRKSNSLVSFQSIRFSSPHDFLALVKPSRLPSQPLKGCSLKSGCSFALPRPPNGTA